MGSNIQEKSIHSLSLLFRSFIKKLQAFKSIISSFHDGHSFKGKGNTTFRNLHTNICFVLQI